ncbi:hypothetical protein A9Q95_02330 [Rhodobacterales bacterium 59_46_T64]|nr:hypothetical protein A9Q95_02330 [Rhodobacterales bacterium 59_46_T64]
MRGNLRAAMLLPYLRPDRGIMTCDISRIGGRCAADLSKRQGAVEMQTITQGYRGLSLLFSINWDRILYIATIVVALMAGAFVGSIGVN